MFGSVLHGTITNFNTHWYCSKNFNDEYIWIKDEYFIPPLINCLADYLTCKYDPNTKKPTSQTGADIYTIDFGGLSAIRYLDPGVFGHHVIPDMISVINTFESHGYQEKVDLWGAPYDWRLSPVNIEESYDALRDLVERVYDQTGQKVILYGMSGGTMVNQIFFTEFMKDRQDWKDKYIKGIIQHSPSIGGSGIAPEVVWRGYIDFFPTIWQETSLGNMARSIPTVYGHFPNVISNPTDTYFIGPNGEEYKAADLPKLLLDHGKIPDSVKDIFNVSYQYSLRDLVHPGVPVYFIFNSILPTVAGLEFTKGWDDDKPSYHYLTGDDTIPTSSLLYPCTKWTGGKPVVCHDFQTTNTSWSHAGQLSIPEVLNLIYEVATNTSWTEKPGTTMIKGTNMLKKKK